MFYAFIAVLWAVSVWLLYTVSDMLFYANNYQSFPGASAVMVPGLILIFALFLLSAKKLLKLCLNHYQKDQQKKAASAVPAISEVPIQENK